MREEGRVSGEYFVDRGGRLVSKHYEVHGRAEGIKMVRDVVVLDLRAGEAERLLAAVYFLMTERTEFEMSCLHGRLSEIRLEEAKSEEE